MEDTIAAIATAQGEGGIGIVRLSGEDSGKILSRIFTREDFSRSQENNRNVESSRNGESKIFENSFPENKTFENRIFENRKMHYGYIVDPKSGEQIDEVLAVFFKAPNTYTKEDVVEINCHGNIVALRRILSLVIREGARLAEKGEFTKRAFLNGRIDLSQAEAVIDMVKAKTDKGFSVAMSQLSGMLSSEIKKIRAEIMDVLVNVTVNLDYPDEDIEEVAYSDLEKSLKSIGDMIGKLMDTADTGRILQEGLNVVIVGRPNVGKSSLMNALVRDDRSIVTEVPGTTRDIVHEMIHVRDIPVKLIDTAGIRDTEEIVEKIGIEKSKDSFNKADLVILILNGAESLSKEDLYIMNHLTENKAIVLLNKRDLGLVLKKEMIMERIAPIAIIETSVKNNVGIGELEDLIEELVYAGKVTQEDNMLVTNLRQLELLTKSKEAVEDALLATVQKEALDFIEIDIKNAWLLLGEIIGETVAEDIIDEVFSRFCLGK